MSDQTSPSAPESIRLDILDHTTPHSTYADISKLYFAAFDVTSPIFTYLYPPPRPPVEEMAATGAYQQVLEVQNPHSIYVTATAVLGDGTERLAGVALWGKPGYRHTAKTEETMSDEEKHAWQGYDHAFRNMFRQTMQDHRDRLMGDEPYWYLSALAVHPDFQKFKVGSKLIDQGISWASRDNLPVLLESSAVARQFYESRGFVKEDEFGLDNAEQYAGLEEIKFPLYRRPATRAI